MNIADIDYDIQPEQLRAFLKTKAPNGIKCSVCGADHWGTSSDQHAAKPDSALSVFDFDISRAPPGQTLATRLAGRRYYGLICLNCTHTLFFSATLLQSMLPKKGDA
jgi:hypothetical protein